MFGANVSAETVDCARQRLYALSAAGVEACFACYDERAEADRRRAPAFLYRSASACFCQSTIPCASSGSLAWADGRVAARSATVMEVLLANLDDFRSPDLVDISPMALVRAALLAACAQPRVA